MKLWINFEEKDIKKRINGWKEGDDFKGQLIFENQSDPDNSEIKFEEDKISIGFDNGFLEIDKFELGSLFK